MADLIYRKLEEIYGVLPEGAEQEIHPAAAEVLLHFGTYCSVPHGSGNERQLTEILAGLFAEEGRRIRIDEGCFNLSGAETRLMRFAETQGDAPAETVTAELFASISELLK